MTQPSVLELLRSRVRARSIPENWLADALHPIDRLHGQSFLDRVSSGEEPAAIFQSAIPYFSVLSDQARIRYLPDMLSAAADDPFLLLSMVVDLRSQRGSDLLDALTAQERELFCRFAQDLPETGVLQICIDEIHEIRRILTVH